jgi:hypothetical protein
LIIVRISQLLAQRNIIVRIFIVLICIETLISGWSSIIFPRVRKRIYWIFFLHFTATNRRIFDRLNFSINFFLLLGTQMGTFLNILLFIIINASFIFYFSIYDIIVSQIIFSICIIFTINTIPVILLPFNIWNLTTILWQFV